MQETSTVQAIPPADCTCAVPTYLLEVYLLQAVNDGGADLAGYRLLAAILGRLAPPHALALSCTGQPASGEQINTTEVGQHRPGATEEQVRVAPGAAHAENDGCN